jgi:hypothetical protein
MRKYYSKMRAAPAFSSTPCISKHFWGQQDWCADFNDRFWQEVPKSVRFWQPLRPFSVYTSIG